MTVVDKKKVMEFLTEYGGSNEERLERLVKMIEDDSFAPDPPIDTTNDFLFGTNGDHIAPMIPITPSTAMSKELALRAAAWLVALANPTCEQWDKVLKAVLNS